MPLSPCPAAHSATVVHQQVPLLKPAGAGAHKFILHGMRAGGRYALGGGREITADAEGQLRFGAAAGAVSVTLL